jgi:hyaluronate lyase
VAYALVPNASEAALDRYANGPVSVPANTTRLQAVKHSNLGLTLANAFTTGTHNVAGLSIDGPASVIVRGDHRRMTVAVSDPTMGRDEIAVIVRGPQLRPISPAEGVVVSGTAGGTLLRFTTHHVYGRSLAVTLTS